MQPGDVVAGGVEQQRNVKHGGDRVVSGARYCDSATGRSGGGKVDGREDVLRRHPRTGLSVYLNQAPEAQVGAAQFEVLQCAVAGIRELSAWLPRCAFGDGVLRELSLQKILRHLAQKFTAIPVLKIAAGSFGHRGLAVRSDAKQNW